MRSLTWENCKTIEATKYAKLHGSDYAYYITSVDNKNEFELALIDSNGNWENGIFKRCPTLSQAEEQANQHYSTLVKTLVN